MSLKGGHGFDYTKVDTEQKAGLGKEMEIKGLGTFKYMKAAAAIAQFALAQLDDNGTAVECTTTTAGAKPAACGVPQVAVPINNYAWFWVGDGGYVADSNYSFATNTFVNEVIKVLAAASCVADTKLYTTATAGVLDDAVTTQIFGLLLTATNGGSQAAVACFAPDRITVNC